jgi:zinc finger MIZ domain-containing protein
MAYNLLYDINAIAKLEHQIMQSGGEDQLRGDLERPRYALLNSACREGDLFFIILHQLFCCWSVETEFVRK